MAENEMLISVALIIISRFGCLTSFISYSTCDDLGMRIRKKKTILTNIKTARCLSIFLKMYAIIASLSLSLSNCYYYVD